MLGTAAKVSTTNDNGARNFGDATSERNMAIRRLIGTPTAIATAELKRVPIIYGSAPNDSRPSTAFQSVLVKNLKPSKENMSRDPLATEYTTIATINIVYAAAAIVTIRNILSTLPFPAF
jgi:hypothetical protein